MDTIKNYISSEKDRLIQELVDLLKIPSVSADPAYQTDVWTPVCLMSRAQNLWVQLYAASLWTASGGMEGEAPERGLVCSLGNCEESALNVWDDIQQAAERHYDRSEDCSFTTFVGYEYTQGQEMANLHRNVIFKGEEVTRLPISVFDTDSSVPELWRRLRSQCLESDSGHRAGR